MQYILDALHVLRHVGAAAFLVDLLLRLGALGAEAVDYVLNECSPMEENAKMVPSS